MKVNDTLQSIKIDSEILSIDYDKSSLSLRGIDDENSVDNTEAAIKYGIIGHN